MAHSPTNRKPAKPYRDFPLFAHVTGRWAKKIRGRIYYFGAWDDADGALAKYLEQRDDLAAGRTPRPSTSGQSARSPSDVQTPRSSSDGLTVRQLCNRFLTAKKQQRDAGDIKDLTFADYKRACAILLKCVGKNQWVDELRVEDFERLRDKLAKKYGVHRLGNTVQRIRTIFKYGYDAGLIDRPMRFGPTFKKPARRLLRAQRQKNGPRMFEADQLRRIIDAAAQPLRAMILLGINCGFGNADCGQLPIDALDLRKRWVDFPRPKTGIERHCPLWPETVAAIEEWLQRRPRPKSPDHEGLVFTTKYGGSWAKNTDDRPITKEFRKLLDDLSLYRPGLGFYTLRHNFETIGGDTGDQVAVNSIMGHADNSMAAVYRERIHPDRLRRVVNHVRSWLFESKELYDMAG